MSAETIFARSVAPGERYIPPFTTRHCPDT